MCILSDLAVSYIEDKLSLLSICSCYIPDDVRPEYIKAINRVQNQINEGKHNGDCLESALFNLDSNLDIAVELSDENREAMLQDIDIMFYLSGLC